MIPPAVDQVFRSYPGPARRHLQALRKHILQIAGAIPGVGKLEETLKWGEPAYLTTQSRSGTTIRIAWKPKAPEHYSLFVDCKTSLIDVYRQLFPELYCVGNREIRMPLTAGPPPVIRDCIALALTYKKPALLQDSPWGNQRRALQK